MSLQETLAKEDRAEPGRMVNNLSILVATVNGSGSQTANNVLLRALFKMGIPVSGKNLFPSNIQGMPTWFTIRANREGFVARKENVEILVAMNRTSLREDQLHLVPGGACLYPEDLPADRLRADLSRYPMPVTRLARESGAEASLRPYVANMVYVGVLAWELGVDLAEVEAALQIHFKGKASAVKLNFGVVEAAFHYATQNLQKRDPYRVERMRGTEGLILVDGNTSAALGAIYGGVSFAAWYPITPASSLAETLQEYLPRLRKDPQGGRNDFVIVQAEDELGALGMAVGAGWMGARAMTSTSGPGLSLMAEFSGLASYAEVPVVIWDVQRVGPSTGLPTRVSQGDLMFVHSIGHGGQRQVVLLPGPGECFEFGWLAFDLAARLQAPVFVLSDLDMGMNQWMVSPFRYPDRPIDRGKILTAQDLDRLGGFARYRDVDGDGIPWRTLPGTPHPKAAYFTRGTGHDENAEYSEDPGVYAANMARLGRKYATAAKLVPAPILRSNPGARIGFVGFGSTDPAIEETRHELLGEGTVTDYLRLRALPFTPAVEEFIVAHERTYVVEMNTDGQLFSLLKMDIPQGATRLRSLAHSDGLPLTAEWIAGAFRAQEESSHGR
ncbi:MAG: 2-oxoacid:acceptor oxidoreductase subunit alpha [Anaerolineales bacterium]|jgi:2-oxoglutarate ferredoxin oxidoreductase subunit alpha